MSFAIGSSEPELWFSIPSSSFLNQRVPSDHDGEEGGDEERASPEGSGSALRRAQAAGVLHGGAGDGVPPRGRVAGAPAAGPAAAVAAAVPAAAGARGPARRARRARVRPARRAEPPRRLLALIPRGGLDYQRTVHKLL
jgi:hypothetical protein